MNKTKAFLMTLMMTATAMVALAPTAQAAPVNNIDPEEGCISGDWLLVCASVEMDEKYVYKPDPTKLRQTCTDPTGLGDVCVFTVPSVVDAATNREWFPVYEVHESHAVYGDAIVDFACMVLYERPDCIRVSSGLADMDGNGILDAVVIDDYLVPFTV